LFSGLGGPLLSPGLDGLGNHGRARHCGFRGLRSRAGSNVLRVLDS
jgi:hypothetical protein